MDELIYNLRRLSEWTAKELWENPVNFPEGVLKQAADELEKAREIVVLWDMYGGSEGITDAFERAEKARWIPVEEKLPVSGTTVCVAFDTGEVDILYQQWAEWGEDGLEYIDDPAIYSTKKAMYWTEPPAPPKGLPVWGAQE